MSHARRTAVRRIRGGGPDRAPLAGTRARTTGASEALHARVRPSGIPARERTRPIERVHGPALRRRPNGTSEAGKVRLTYCLAWSVIWAETARAAPSDHHLDHSPAAKALGRTPPRSQLQDRTVCFLPVHSDGDTTPSHLPAFNMFIRERPSAPEHGLRPLVQHRRENASDPTDAGRSSGAYEAQMRRRCPTDPCSGLRLREARRQVDRRFAGRV